MGTGGAPGTGGSAGGAGGAGGAACVPHFAAQEPVDLLLLIDQTRFLSDPLQGGRAGTYFSETIRGVSNFVGDAAATGTGVALGYFPLDGTPDSCSAAYTTEIDVSSIPAAASALRGSLGVHVTNNGASAIAPALTSAIAHMRSWGAAHPDRKPLVVLLAGLAEIACTTWDDLYAVALAGFSGTPSVETDVVAVLGDSNRSLQITNQSSKLPFIIPTTQGDMAAAVEQALLALTNPASACQIDRPEFQPHIDFNDSQLSLLYTPNTTGVAVELPRVASASACGSGGGWYLSSGLPKQLIACPTSCTTFTAGRLTARVGCPP